MGTRCVVTFKDDFFGKKREFAVYKHWDGNPDYIVELLNKAKSYAWVLPRFEADEFACAFIVAAKEGEGDVRLTTSADAHGDLDYSYEVFMKDKELWTACYDYTGDCIAVGPLLDLMLDKIEE